jgi:Raf kinase inhibitor-like YbhB/YbcL family protein
VQKVLRNALALASMVCATLVWGQETMALRSSSIVDGKIAKVHACPDMGGKDRSVHLQIDGLPAGTRFVTIVVDDPDALQPAGKVWVHWNVFNIAVDGSSLTIPAGQPPKGDTGRSSGDMQGFEGMCPPNGTHTYRFAAFATAEKWTPPAKTLTIEATEAALGPKALGKALLTGKF